MSVSSTYQVSFKKLWATKFKNRIRSNCDLNPRDENLVGLTAYGEWGRAKRGSRATNSAHVYRKSGEADIPWQHSIFGRAGAPRNPHGLTFCALLHIQCLHTKPKINWAERKISDRVYPQEFLHTECNETLVPRVPRRNHFPLRNSIGLDV